MLEPLIGHSPFGPSAGLRPPPPPSARSAVGAPLVRSLRLLTPSLARSACGHLPTNRRHEMRRLVRLACRVRRMDDWHLMGDRTLDLSPRGMLLLSDERAEEGLDLVVSFQATELPIWFDTCARVTRIVEGRRPGDAGRALGLQFETLPAVSRLILRGFLRRHPLAPPQRELPIDLAHPIADHAAYVPILSSPTADWADRADPSVLIH